MSNRYGDITTLGCIAMLATAFISGLLCAWVSTVLWGWFIAPVFNLPYLNMVQAIGLTYTVRFMMQGIPDTSKTKDYTQRDYAVVCISAILWPTMALGMGWLIYQFSGGG